MKTLASDSYNVAWFKLADFVSRGEKERALSVLRLLMHSVSDEALTLQLEGDILLAFNDDLAVTRYRMAANLYQKNGKFQQAICIYQRSLLHKEEEQTLKELLSIYLLTGYKVGIVQSFSKLAKIFIQKENSQELIAYAVNICEKFDTTLKAIVHAQLVTSLILHDENNGKIAELVRKTVQLFKKDLESSSYSSSDLQKFLSDLKNLNSSEYKKAELYLKEE